MKVKNDPRSEFSNLSNWKEEAWKKKSGLQRDSNPWPPRYRCDALPTELWSHTLGARSICWVHIFPWGVKWCKYIWNNSYDWSHMTEVIWLKSYELFHIYLHHFTPHGKIWTQQINLAPNVWLHSSVGRASHRYRGGHGFESRWSPDFFQASSFQLLKLENSLRGSFFTFTFRAFVCNGSEKERVKNWSSLQTCSISNLSRSSFPFFLRSEGFLLKHRPVSSIETTFVTFSTMWFLYWRAIHYCRCNSTTTTNNRKHQYELSLFMMRSFIFVKILKQHLHTL